MLSTPIMYRRAEATIECVVELSEQTDIEVPSNRKAKLPLSLKAPP